MVAHFCVCALIVMGARLIDFSQLDNKGSACKWEGESLVLPAMTARDLDAADLLLEVSSGG